MPTTPTLLLPYPAPSDPADVPADMGSLANRIEAVRGANNGLASLDSGGKVPSAQLPAAYTHYAAKRRGAAGVPVPTGTLTYVALATVDFDSTGTGMTGGSTSRITIPATAYWAARAHVFFASSAVGYREVYIARNRTAFMAYNAMLPTVGANNAPHMITSVQAMFLNAGDYLEVAVFHNAGADVNISTDQLYSGFEVVRVA